MTKKRSMTVLFVALSCVPVSVSGCSKADPPCPPGAHEVSSAEADAALSARAKREAVAGNGQGDAISFFCVDQKKGDNVIEQIWLKFSDVLACRPGGSLIGSGSLSECLEAMARRTFMGLPKTQTNNNVGPVTSTCKEHERLVEIDADDHGLARAGGDAFVEVVLAAALIAADKMSGPATAIAGFAIRLMAGQEQTCVDTPHGPSAGCLGTDGCGGAPPGATVPGGSGGAGDVIQTGTDPGTPGGDR